MNIHNVITYVHNFDQSDKFQVLFEAHGSSYNVYLTAGVPPVIVDCLTMGHLSVVDCFKGYMMF